MSNMTPQRVAIWAILVLVLIGLTACATPQTFEERLLVGYHTTAETRTTASTLLNARKMGSADAENVQKQADLARQGLDIAKNLRPTDPVTAEQKLSSVHAVIQALKAYLLAKEGK